MHGRRNTATLLAHGHASSGYEMQGFNPPSEAGKAGAQIPHDAESWALFIVEHVPASTRRELGLLLLTAF
jgi:hypothetical protein